MKRFLQFLFKLPIWLMILIWTLTLMLVAVTIVSLCFGINSLWIYLVYAITFVFFVYSVYIAVKYIPLIKRKLVEIAKGHSFTNNLITNYGFKTTIFGIISLVNDFAFAIFNFTFGILNNSVWFITTSFYYLILSIIKCCVFIGGRLAKKHIADKKQLYIKKLKIYRLCGIFLLISELALCGMVTQMVMSKKPIYNSEIIAIVFATFTFYKITMSIINIIKARKLNDPIIQSYRNIGLTSAGTTLISLQVTLISVFSNGDISQMLSMNAITGFAVCILTIIWGVSMVISANKKIERMVIEANFHSRGGNNYEK